MTNTFEFALLRIPEPATTPASILFRTAMFRIVALMRLLAIVLVGASCGCSQLKSRYAMDDPVYAEKYEVGAERGDLLGKAKQAMDARHTEGLGGLYLSGGAQVRPSSGTPMGGAELGAERYVANWVTTRGALSAFLGEDEGFVGLDLGLRVQSPTRIAPFVGIGTFQGGSRGVELAHWDGADNDDDGLIDEYGEEKSIIDSWLSAVYPEVGTHVWVNGTWRLTTYGRYLVTSEGRDHDDWLLGMQLTCFGR